MSQDYKTLRVPEDDYELAKDAKRDDETWGEYLRRCSENPPTIREFVEAESVELFAAGDAEPVDETEVYGDSQVMDVADELMKLREQVERMPDRTADHLEGRFR